MTVPRTPWDAIFLREHLNGAEPSKRIRKVYLLAPRIVIELALASFKDYILVDRLATLMEEDCAKLVSSMADGLQHEYDEWSQSQSPSATAQAFLEAFLESLAHEEAIRLQLSCRLIELTLERFKDETTIEGTARSLQRAAAELAREARHLRTEYGIWLRRHMDEAGIQPDVGPPSTGTVEKSA